MTVPHVTSRPDGWVAHVPGLKVLASDGAEVDASDGVEVDADDTGAESVGAESVADDEASVSPVDGSAADDGGDDDSGDDPTASVDGEALSSSSLAHAALTTVAATKMGRRRRWARSIAGGSPRDTTVKRIADVADAPPRPNHRHHRVTEHPRRLSVLPRQAAGADCHEATSAADVTCRRDAQRSNARRPSCQT